MRTLFFFLIACSIGIVACRDENDNGEPSGDEFFVFGHFYGECGGEGCVEIFKIEDGKLYEDTLDQYPGSTQPYVGAWVELPAAKYEVVKDIVDEVPDALLLETDEVIGQPDAGDWGGIYVQVNSPDASERYWLLDKNENNMNAVYNAFVDNIESAIALINE